MYKKVNPALFSEKELTDLLKAWIAVSVAFAFVLPKTFMENLVLSLITVGAGFVLHELAHRFVARRYGCYAEFRSFDNMLILALIVAYFFKIVFAAPGAVMISGPVGRTRNGKISAAGPATNIVLALIFLAVGQITSLQGLASDIIYYGFLINTWLALFNMIPVGMFDGKKILNWNKVVYGIMVVVPLMLMFFVRPN